MGKNLISMEKKIAIFNNDGYHALDALCVHQDTSIATGKLDDKHFRMPITFLALQYQNRRTSRLSERCEASNISS